VGRRAVDLSRRAQPPRPCGRCRPFGWVTALRPRRMPMVGRSVPGASIISAGPRWPR
jgi:hypothetical protein